MKNSKLLSQHHFLAFFFPGLFLLFNFFIIKTPPADNSFSDFANIANQNLKLPLASFLLIASVFIGIIIDALRNTFCEKLYDKMKKYNMIEAWKKFASFDKDKKDLFYDSYYSYYCFDINIVIASIISLIFYFYTFCYDRTLNIVSWFSLLNILLIYVLIRDASSLRTEMKEFCLVP